MNICGTIKYYAFWNKRNIRRWLLGTRWVVNNDGRKREGCIIAPWLQAASLSLMTRGCHNYSAFFFSSIANLFIVPKKPFLLYYAPLSWIPWNLSFRYIHCTGQFTPKMKANAVPRLLSPLVWIDHDNEYIWEWQDSWNSWFGSYIYLSFWSFRVILKCYGWWA